jgi:hypothetical protein
MIKSRPRASRNGAAKSYHHAAGHTNGGGLRKAGAFLKEHGPKAAKLFDFARPFLGSLLGGGETATSVLGGLDTARGWLGKIGGASYALPAQYSDGMSGAGHSMMMPLNQRNNADGVDALAPVSGGYVQFSTAERQRARRPITLPGGPSNFPHKSIYFPSAGSSAEFYNVGQNDYRGAPGFFSSAYGEVGAPSARGARSLATGATTSLWNPSVWDASYTQDFDYGRAPDVGYYNRDYQPATITEYD